MNKTLGTGSIDRSARVRRIKRVIIALIVIAIIFPSVLCIILFAKLHKLEKQIIKHRTRLEKNLRLDALKTPEIIEGEELEDEYEPRIVKVKRFDMKPMTVEEAMLQLELLGHSFYVFTNAETNDINVIYQRRDGNFGLIEPE